MGRVCEGHAHGSVLTSVAITVGNLAPSRGIAQVWKEPEKDWVVSYL